MRWMSVLAVAALAAAEGEAPRFRFGKDDVGKVPAGWKADKTSKGAGSVWKVVADGTAPSKSGYALAQTAKGPNALFNLCVAEDKRWRDVELSVAFKAVAGELDRGGGLVWRHRDAAIVKQPTSLREMIDVSQARDLWDVLSGPHDFGCIGPRAA